MGWEQRSGAGRYYVRKVREGKRVRSEYIGGGDLAAIVAYDDKQARVQRGLQRQAAQERRERWNAVQEPITAFSEAVNKTVAVVLEQAGYHRQNRGPWRKRMAGKTSADKKQAGLEVRQEIVMQQAATSQAGCDVLYTVLDQSGRSASLVADVTTTAHQLLKQEENLIVREAWNRQMRNLRQELGADTAPPLERLLIERIVLCHYALHEAEVKLSTVQSAGHRYAEGQYRDAIMDRAHRRYLAAIKALAEVRKLKLPNVQVNIGEKQININSPGAVSDN